MCQKANDLMREAVCYMGLFGGSRSTDLVYEDVRVWHLLLGCSMGAQFLTYLRGASVAV
jgi:hypothetical protein